MDLERESDPYSAPRAEPSARINATTDLEREQERLTYRLCRLGFAILSMALIVACLSTMISLPRHFGARGFMPWLQHSAWWQWVDAPVVWGSLIGTYLLWGRWSDPGWQRRAGLLVVMGSVDAVLWLLEHGADLGLGTDEVGHLWLRHNVGQALGWAEFALIASLSCEVLVHLGVSQAAETGRATRSLAATGAVVWMLYFYMMTDWSRWPLGWQRPTLPCLLLDLGSTMIWTITLIQVTALAVAATRQCTDVLAEMDREDAENDPLKSASERNIRSLPGFEGALSDREPPDYAKG
jgi:hypothetical protein